MPNYDEAEKHLSQGDELVAQSRYNAAFEEYKQAIVKKPNYGEAYKRFGVALTGFGRYQEAIEQFKKAVEKAPINGFDVDTISDSLNRIRKQSEAIDQFQKIVISLDNVDAFKQWGQILFGIEKHDGAIEQFRKAIEKNPISGFDVDRISEALNKIDGPEITIELLQETIQNLDSSHAYYYWGQILGRIGKHQEAIFQFQKAVKKNRNFAEAYNSLGLAHVLLGNYQEAIAEFQKASKKKSNYAEAYMHWGNTLAQLGEHENAIVQYRKAVKCAPKDGAIYYYWQQAITKLENKEVAITDYQKALDANIDYADAFFEWGDTLDNLGKHDDAIVQYKKAIEKDPTNWNIYNRLSDVIAKSDMQEEFIKQLQLTIDKIDNANLYNSWGGTLAALGSYDKAIEQYQKAIEKDPQLGYNQEHILETINQIKNQEAVIRQFQNIIEKIDQADIYRQWSYTLIVLKKYDQAVAQYQNAITKNPDLVFDINELIQALSDNKDQENTIKHFKLTIDQLDQANAYNVWGQTLADLEKYDEAISYYQKAIDKKRDFAEAYNNLGQALAQVGKYRKACEQFQKATTYKSNYSEAYINWGQVFIKVGNPHEAIKQYQKAIESDPQNEPVFNDLRQALDLLGKKEETIEQIQNIIEKLDDPIIYDRWGSTLAKIGKYESAIGQFRKAVAKDSDHKSAYDNWQNSLSKTDMSKEAIAVYEQMIEENFNNAQSYAKWGDTLFNRSKYQEAMKRYEKALEKDTKHENAYYMLSACLLNLRRYDEAIEQAQNVIDILPEYAPAYNILGLSLAGKKKYDKAIKQYQMAIEKDYLFLKKHFYMNWAGALYQLKDYDEATKKYETAIENDTSDHNTYFDFAYFFTEIKRYDDAIDQYEKCIKLKTDFAYAYHNIANILERQGKYLAARKKWQETIDVYLKSSQDAKDTRLSDHFGYYASVLHIVFGELEKAEAVYKEGFAINPENTLILTNLVRLYREKMDEHLTNENFGDMTSAHWKAWEYFKKAEKALTGRLTGTNDSPTLIDLGELYFIMEKYSEAEGRLLEAIKNDDESSRGYPILGAVYLRQNEYKKAIDSFKKAIERDPDDLGLRSSLAEAFLKAGMQDEAEAEYKRILGVTSYHVESLIGLGEVYTAIAEKDDPDKYSDAISFFSKALETADSENRSKNLKKKEQAAVHYSRGYARSKLYERSNFRNQSLINEALEDFKKCRDCDPSHLKAMRAIEKIETKYGRFSAQSLAEKVGPWAIFILSLLVFVGSQISFYIFPILSTPYVKINEKMLKTFEKGLPEDVLKGLNEVVDQDFISEEKLFDALKAATGIELADSLKSMIIKGAVYGRSLQEFPNLSAGYYFLFSFGSLMFAVVGLYLPQILKIKFGSIEVEKSAVEQITTSGTLGIKK